MLLTTAKGQCIRFPVPEVRVFKGRDSMGVRGINLAEGDDIISMAILRHVEATSEDRAELPQDAPRGHGEQTNGENGATDAEEETAQAVALSPERYTEMSAQEQFILTVSERGYGKRTSSYEYTGSPGAAEKASPRWRSTAATAASWRPSRWSTRTRSCSSRIAASSSASRSKDIRVVGRGTQGVTVFSTRDGERVVSVASTSRATMRWKATSLQVRRGVGGIAGHRAACRVIPGEGSRARAGDPHPECTGVRVPFPALRAAEVHRALSLTPAEPRRRRLPWNAPGQVRHHHDTHRALYRHLRPVWQRPSRRGRASLPPRRPARHRDRRPLVQGSHLSGRRARREMLREAAGRSLRQSRQISISRPSTISRSMRPGATGASILARSLRDGTDLDYEMQMAAMNATMAPDVQTVFFPASPMVRPITATLVRQIAAMGGDVSRLRAPYRRRPSEAEVRAAVRPHSSRRLDR